MLHQPKTNQAVLLLDERRRVCIVEFLVVQVDQVRAGRKARALWATCPPATPAAVEETWNKKI